MTDSNQFFSETKKELETYLENRALLIKMQIISTSSRMVAKLIVGFLLGLLGFFMLFFLSIMAGYFFADITGSLYIGYGIVVGFYLIVFIIIYWNRRSIKNSISDSIIKILFNKDE